MRYLNTGTWIDNIDTSIIPYFYDNNNYYPLKYHIPIENKDLLIEYSKNAYKTLIKEAQFNFERNDPFLFSNEFVFKNIMTKEDIYSNILRFDFVQTLDNDYKLIEANANTPCAIPESFYGNFVYNKKFEEEILSNEKLANVFIQECNKVKLKKHYEKINIVFAASDEYIEDYFNAKYLYNNFKRFNSCKQYEAFLTSLSNLVIYNDDVRCGVYLPDGRMIDVLYCLHPTEMMIHDESEDGYPIGLKMIEFHYNDIVRLINPPGSIFLQNKELFKYLTNVPFIPKTLNGSSNFNKPVIAKPVFGREGQDICIFNNMNECRNKLYHLSDYLIQEYIEQPIKKVVPIDGDSFDAYITYSVFMLNGYPSVFYVRASKDKICKEDAFWVPSI